MYQDIEGGTDQDSVPIISETQIGGTVKKLPLKVVWIVKTEIAHV